MAVSHTPGPWRVFTTPTGNKIIGIGEQTGEGITDCGFGLWRGGDEEVLANARLIAAAPQMLEALKVAQSALAMLTDPEAIKANRVQVAWATAVEAELAARNAIAAAEAEGR